MTELQPIPGPIDDLEALLRSARDYVHPSDDLRPRVLEAARSQRGERLALSYLQHAAIALVFLGVLGLALQGTGKTGEPGMFATAAADQLLSAAAGDRDWGLVDSFTELRRRQAVLLGSSGEFPRRKA